MAFVAIVLVGATACADPGGDALEAVIASAEELVDKIESAHAPLDPHALEAWVERVKPGLMAIVREDARALGPARRRELEARWARVRDVLLRRIEPPKPPGARP